jgi:two-component system NtrC family sensor kinase
MPTEQSSRQRALSSIGHLECKESQLWRVTLLLVTLLAAGVAVSSWESIRALPHRLEAVPIGVFVLFALFAVYAWSKKREIAELRGFVRGLEERAETPPTAEQLEQLVETLSRSQRGYRELIDNLSDPVFALSLEGEIRAANRRCAELLEEPVAELVGRRLDEFLDQPSRASAEKALRRFLELRQWSGTIRVRLKKGGTIRYFDCVLHAIVKDDRAVGISGLARDITQERESELRFTRLFETLQEGVYFTTPDGTLLDANPALVRMLGYESKEELLGAKFNDLYLGAPDRHPLLRELEQHARTRDREITLRRKDGRPLICLDFSTAIYDPSGRAARYQGTLVDITERREMEKRLHKEQEFATRLVMSFPDVIVVLDAQGRYTFVSPRIKELLDYTPEELVGRMVGERSEPEDRSALLELHGELIAGKRTSGTLEYRIQHKNGNWRMFRITASPLFDVDGKITGVVASLRDVTEFKRLGQQLIQSEKLAAIGQMIAGVAHELNNPLTAILGVSDLLRERAGDASLRRQAELVHQQARRAAHIVQNLLAFSRPISPHKLRLNLSDLIQRTLQLHDYSLRANNIAVDFLAEPNLPLVFGEPNQLVQVFLNLITNAEQAIREVRDRGTLRVRLRRTDTCVSAVFQDDGPGIGPDALPHIFDPFFTTKRPGRGTGLGLSICMAIAKEHGATIEAQTAPGGGAVFTVAFPVASESEIRGEPAGAPAALGSLRG